MPSVGQILLPSTLEYILYAGIDLYNFNTRSVTTAVTIISIERGSKLKYIASCGISFCNNYVIFINNDIDPTVDSNAHSNTKTVTFKSTRRNIKYKGTVVEYTPNDIFKPNLMQLTCRSCRKDKNNVLFIYIIITSN